MTISHTQLHRKTILGLFQLKIYHRYTKSNQLNLAYFDKEFWVYVDDPSFTFKNPSGLKQYELNVKFEKFRLKCAQPFPAILSGDWFDRYEK